MKKIKNFFILVLIAVILCSYLPPSASAATDPNIQAGAVVLLETNTDTVFYSKSPHDKIYPASTTKIMTVLLCVEAIERGEASLDDIVTASDTALYDMVPDGSTQNIQPGEQLRLEDLMYCALVASANEACNIIAEHLSGGDIQAFIDEMNSRAEELGCTGTHFANTHGLPNDDHYTTAYDLALIAKEAVSHDEFKTICSTVTYTVPATNMSEERTFTNTNKLIDSDSIYYYQYASGIKTGTTNAAGYCLVSMAERDGISLLAVVMKANSVVAEDGTTEIQSFTESRRLYEWAFESFSYKTILTASELITSVPVSMGDGADSVILRPAEEVTALMDNQIDIENDITRTVTVFSQENGEELTAPIKAGTVLGKITLTYDGREFASIDLVANTSIDLLKAEYMKNRVKGTLSQTWLRVVIGVIIFIFLLYAFLVIRYNIIRRRRRKAARLRRQRELEARRRSYVPTTGKSFEDIYDKYDR